MTIGVVNPTDQPVRLDDITGLDLPSTATRWHLGGQDEHDYNRPGHPRTLDLVETQNLSTKTDLIAPALSAAVFEFKLR